MSVVALIDYGAGNLRSVHNALVAAGADNVAVTADPEVVGQADRIVLPGVGAFAACMNGLSAIDGLIEAMEQRVRGQGAPFLGICVGMQLLRSEEHTSELQSLMRISYAVFCLKKKHTKNKRESRN